MAASNENKKGIAHLALQLGQQIRQDSRQESGETSRQEGGGEGAGPPRIFNVLDYIEQAWGLNMKLFPAQRFLVKLYYHLELDDKIPEDPHKRIKVTDKFGDKVLHTFSEKDYLSYLFSEGRCNIGVQDHERRELVLAIGRRAGKCVEGDTLVATDRGLIRIEDLGEAPEEGFSPLAVGVAQEGSRKAQSVAFYNGGVKPTFSVRTKSGYGLVGTGNHRVKVMGNSGRIEWRCLDDIRPGDFIAIHRTSDLWPSEAVDLRAFHNEDGRKDVALPQALDEKWGNLLGYLVGDGTWGDGMAVSVTVEHPETWDHLRTLFREVLGEPRVQMDERTANTGRLEFCSVRARRFLDALGWKLDCARDAKMIPWVILRSPKPVVCAFLRGLFETDGCAESGGRNITFSSASFRLAREVQVVLLNLGIISNVARKWNAKTKKHYAVLSVKGVRSRQAYARWIGFDSEKKRAPMLASLEMAQEGKSDTESLPHQYLAIRNWLESVPKRNPARGELGWGRSQLREALGNTCKGGSEEDLTYPRLRKALEVAKEISAGTTETIHFEELLAADYFYDPVVVVEEGESQVYDLTVPEGESFVANGMTNHNTTLSGIFASYEIYRLLNLYNPQEYFGLPNGNVIQLISVATGKEQAGLLFNEVTSHLAKCDYFKPFIASNTLSNVKFRTPYEIDKFGPLNRQENGKFVSFNGKASLRVSFNSCNGRGLRGFGNIVIILDEIAHFQNKGISSADEIYNAITPSSAAFSRKDADTGLPLKNKDGDDVLESRIILISSPLGRSGKFYEKFDLAMRGGMGANNILAIQAPTWEINPTVPSSYYREKFHEDPVSFMTEHGAQFSDQVRGWIERESDLQDCIKPQARPKAAARPRMPHQMGIDVGLVNDGTAVAITHVEEDRIVHDYHEIWYAGVDWRESNPHLEGAYTTPYARGLTDVARLDFDAIAELIVALCRKFHITAGLFDRWNGIPLEQSLHKRGLRQFKSQFFTPDDRSKMFQTAKLFMYDKKLELYDYPIPEIAKQGGTKHSALIAELLSLQAHQASKNIVRVQAPDGTNHHDDMSDALVRAIWESSEVLLNQKHTAHGSLYHPHAAGTMTPQRYQMVRARQHGISDRSTLGRRIMRAR